VSYTQFGLACLTRESTNPELDGSLQNILLFLIFQILQRRVTILSIWRCGADRLIMESQFAIFSWELTGGNILT